MYSRHIRTDVLGALLFLSGTFWAASEACGQIAVGLNPATSRALPEHFYGANGQERNSVPWLQTDNTALAQALQGLQYGLLRYPTGTGSNFWNWSTGDYIDNYPVPPAVSAPPSPYPSPLPELQRELAAASQPTGTQTVGVFPLNVIENPLCPVPVGGGLCTYSPSSPNETYQFELLNTLASDGIKVPHVELGNEIYGGGATGFYAQVYPTAADYVAAMSAMTPATLQNSWIHDFKTAYPSLTISVPTAICDSKVSCDTRKGAWNQGLMNAFAIVIANGEAATLPDAVTLHNYSGSGLAPGVMVDANNADTMLRQPFLFWDAIVSEVLPALEIPGYTPSVWFTEYNFRDDNPKNSVQLAGTWAHGLYLATYSLLYVTQPRVKMALHHDVQGGVEFADIFAADAKFSNTQIHAALYGYSASGLTTREIDTAALGQNHAEALTFSGGPTFSDGHPKLIGEAYSTVTSGAAGGTAPTQLIILNLDSNAQTVDLSVLSKDVLSKGGTYRQIDGDPATYVDGKTAPNGFEGFPTDLTLTTGTLVSGSPHLPLQLPAFSITRITAN